PDKVMEVLQTISKNLYDTMADKMKASELSSALTFYNDKQITKELTGYKEQLKKEEDRLTEIEDRYYKQFASMETALSKLSSQSSSLASMLGMGQY
ncbi:MAG: flagellar capping protein, partial [Lachnospiraceae bacterium]|nr:flagellar capping protein [Lachnospiraceae bacterium]